MNAKDLKKEGIYVGPSIFYPQKSLKIILENLTEDENILVATSCNSDSKAGAVAVTNKRVVFASKVLFTSEFKDFDIKKITSVNYKSSFGNKLSIQGSSDSLEISAVAKDPGQKIVNIIKKSQNDSMSEKTSNNSIGLKDLEKLAELKDMGIITEDEFNSKKKAILGI